MADVAATAVRPRAVTPELGSIAIGAGTAVAVGALGAADGGYFPSAWGWTALVALWLVGAWLLLGRAAVTGGRLGAGFLAAIAALGAWTWLSLLWTDNSVQTTLEGFRLLAYVGAVAALVLIVRREAATALLRGLLIGICLVALYGLATRLFPDRLGTYDPISSYRLSEPVGYWNGLGLFAGMGALLALGMLARERSIAARAAAAAAFTLLVPTVYFTFSRGAAIALGFGIVAAIAVDTRRLQLVLALLVAAVPALIGVWLASESEALTTRDSPLSAAADQGRALALVLVLLAVAAAFGAAAVAIAERRVTPPRAVRLAFATALVVVVVAAVGGILVRFGGPVDFGREAYDAFRETPPSLARQQDLSERLFTFSGSYRVELWRESWDQYAAHPVLGDGPGTYEQYWNAHRPIAHKVRDAHSVYLETLAELGPLGLALLAVALAVPLVAVPAARRHPLASSAVGAYAAYLVHAGVDWDWELPALTIVAFACGVALIALRAPDAAPLTATGRTRIAGAAVALVLSAAAFVGLIGFSALTASDNAAAAVSADWRESATEARKAERWLPWSSEPWQRLGEAQIAQGRLRDARRSIRNAIAKEPDDWLLWFRLAEASSGADRRRALAQARRLNPLSPEVERLAAEGG